MCIWSIEADIFDFDDRDITSLVYINDDVDKFLKAKDSMGIAACKGMGKTFLLKAKRMIMMNNSQGVMTLPADRLVDVSGTIAINSMHRNFLSSYNNWISLWISCISIYLLSLDEFKNIISEYERTELDDCVQKLIRSKNIGIFNVLHKILNYKSKEKLNKVVMSATLLFDYVQRINTAVAIFVDKLEEPFNRGYYPIPGSSKSVEGNFNSSIWAYAQLSFVEAVYTFYSSRHHIKIFYSIRREALFRGEEISSEYQKFRDRVIRLSYTSEELYKMFCVYVENEKENELFSPEYASTNPIKALVGFDTITHKSGIEENVWDYIYRHTFQRPRDIMEMGDAIHNHIVCKKDIMLQKHDLCVRKLRQWVNEISTMECKAYISFLDPFINMGDNILFKEQILKFARTLPMNTFTDESMVFYCHKMNYGNYDNTDCLSCNEMHYFSTLYNIGLLGYIYESENDNSYIMEIKHISQSKFDYNHQSIPQAIIYYLHPGFSNIVKKEREISMKSYYPCKYILNSIENVVDKYNVRRIVDSVNSALGNSNDNTVFITSTGRDLENERKRIRNLLENKGYKVFTYEDHDFPQKKNFMDQYNGATHDHCIDVMLKCKHLIYIFSGRFGGKYAGRKYTGYYEHKDTIQQTPSISFMEYLVGISNEKNVKVYVDEKVDIARGEYIANGQPDNYNSKAVENTMVFKQLGYFNQLGNGTWYDKYSNYDDLEEYINAHFEKQN